MYAGGWGPLLAASDEEGELCGEVSHFRQCTLENGIPNWLAYNSQVIVYLSNCLFIINFINLWDVISVYNNYTV